MRKVHKLANDRVEEALDIRSIMRQQSVLSALSRQIFSKKQERRLLKMQKHRRVLQPVGKESSSSADSVAFFGSGDDERTLDHLIKIDWSKSSVSCDGIQTLLKGVFPKKLASAQ